MADKIVSLEFQGQGVKGLTQDVLALANAIGQLPDQFVFSAGGGSGGGHGRGGNRGGGGNAPALPKPPALANGPAQALQSAISNLKNANASGNALAIQDAHHLLRQAQKSYANAFFPGQKGGSQQQSLASAAAQVKVSVSAVAQAASGSAGSVGTLVSALSKLPPEIAVVVGAIALLTAAAAHGYNAAQSALTPSFQYGNKAYNATRGMFRTLGVDDPAGKSRALSDAIASNPIARVAAMRAGINPNNSLYGGDLNDLGKSSAFLRRYGDPTKSSDREAQVAGRSTGGVFDDELARLRAASAEVRKMALNDTAEALDPQKLRAAADAQLKWNHLVGKFSDLVVSVSGPILDAINAIIDANPFNHNYIAPKGAGGFAGSKTNQDKEKLSRDKNTEAIDRLTHAVDGAYGGGQRTHNPVPPGWGAEQYRQGVFQRAAPLGHL